MKKLINISVFVLLAIYLVGCQNQGKKVLAKAGGVKITEEDFSRELDNLPEGYRKYVSTLEGKKQLLDILLREKLLINSAERAGIYKKPDVQKALKEYQKRIQDQEKEFKKSVLLKEYLRELQDKELKVTEAEMKEYYDQNKAQFQNPKRIRVSHILTPGPEEAQDALQRIKSGENFAKVARESSRDPSAQNDGSIGEVTTGDFVNELPEFEKELAKLRVGQVSGVVKTKLGYHVIKKDDEKAMPKQSFEDSVGGIRRALEKKKFDEWMETAKKKQKVWINENALASLKIPDASSQLPPGAARER